MTSGAFRSRCPSGFVAQLHPGSRSQVLHGFCKGQAVNFHHKGDDVSTFTTAKAVKTADTWPHVERRASLIVKWAQTLEGAHACRFERDVSTNDVFNGRALTHCRNVVSIDSARHTPTLEPRVCRLDCDGGWSRTMRGQQ